MPEDILRNGHTKHIKHDCICQLQAQNFMECPFAALKLVTNYLNKDDLVKMMFVNKQWATVLDNHLKQSLRLHFAIRYGKKWTFNGKSHLPDTYMVVLNKRNYKIPYKWGTAEHDLDYKMVGEINIVEESKEAKMT